MAKRKTPKVKDLRPTSITKEQLQAIQQIVQPINNMQMELGRIETTKHAMLHQVIKLQESLQEENVALRKEYGEVNININDGTITYPEDAKANS
jgi:hypothetical protein|tara:strand:- start:141 stop:422 length:282 start_codon:yes stop_codon:yes gene_type:complete